MATAIGAVAWAQPCGTWQWTNPVPRPVALNAVTYGGGVFLALGDGEAFTSRDGISWEVRSTDAPVTWTAVTWDGSQFVAVGGPSVGTSPDGLTWTVRYTASPYLGRVVTFYGIAFSGDRYLAVGYDGWSMDAAVVTSADLINWSRVGVSGGPFASSLWAVTWTGSTFVAVGNGAAVISRDAATWQWSPNVYAFDVAWSGHELVAVSESAVYRSPDGLVWEEVPAPRGGAAGVTWAGTRFVAVGSDGAVLTSSDGHTWKDHSTAVQYAMRRVTWDGRQLVAVGNNIFTSDDGVTWQPWAAQITSAVLNAVAWNGSAYVAVGARGEIVRSPDGIVWTRTREPGNGFERNGSLGGVVWTGTRFVAVGDRFLGDERGYALPGAAVTTSPDGITWSTQLLPVNLQSVAWDGEKLVAVGDSWGSAGLSLMTSADGLTWDAVPAPQDFPCCWSAPAVTATPGRFVASVLPTAVATSTDGLHWVATALPLRPQMWAGQLAAGGGRFVAYGDQAFASSDGTTWTPASGISKVTAVTWAGNRFLAWDPGGQAFTSFDGVAWSLAYDAPAAPPAGIAAFAAGTGALVGVGEGGKIVRSPCAGLPRARRHLSSRPPP